MKNIRKEIIQIFGIITALGIVGYACKKNRFKKEDFLTSFYEYKIEPEISQAVNSASSLNVAWTNYSGSNSADDFTQAKNKYGILADDLERISFYNLGDVSAIYVFNRFYKTTVDTSGIIDLYNSQESFSVTDVNGYTNTQKGLFALEYLLFSSTFSDSASSTRYISFINAQIASLQEGLVDFQTSWKVYQKNFTEQTDDGVTGSYNIVINRIIHVLEDLINKRINQPLNANDPQLAVGYYKKDALNKIQIQINQLKNIYQGIGTEEFNSVYNSVRKKNKKLADQITDQFEEIAAYEVTLTNTMEDYIIDDTTPLITYKDLITDLLVLFKNDVQKELDVIITFGDTDGD